METADNESSSPKPSTSPACQSIHATKAIAEAKKKFNSALEDDLLDYKHNHPQLIESCASLLIKIFSNILENPHEDKFRQVKATSNALKLNVLNIKGGEHLLTLAGFKPQVVDLQKHWVFESDVHGTKDAILRECCGVLVKAIQTIHDKAERKRLEHEAKLNQEKERRDAIVRQMEEDQLWRRVKAEQEAAAASALASAAAASAQDHASARAMGREPPAAVAVAEVGVGVVRELEREPPPAGSTESPPEPTSGQ